MVHFFHGVFYLIASNPFGGKSGKCADNLHFEPTTAIRRILLLLFARYTNTFTHMNSRYIFVHRLWAMQLKHKMISWEFFNLPHNNYAFHAFESFPKTNNSLHEFEQKYFSVTHNWNEFFLHISTGSTKQNAHNSLNIHNSVD